MVDNYELCVNIYCQVYKGLDVYLEIDAVVIVIRGKVLIYKDELIDVVYFVVSGGVIAVFNDLWNGIKCFYLIFVVDVINNIWDIFKNSLVID